MSRKLSNPLTPEDIEWLQNNNRSHEVPEAPSSPYSPEYVPPLLTEDEDDYDEWKVAELREEVLARGIELGDGKVLKANLIKFLREDDVAEASA